MIGLSLENGHDVPLQQLLYLSLDQAPYAVFWVNKDGNFSYVNQQACRLLGYSHDELKQLHPWEIEPGYSQEQWYTAWLRPAQDKNHFCELFTETFHRHKDGTLIPVEVSAKKISLGSTDFRVVFVRDTIERKKSEKELKLIQFSLDHSSIAMLRIAMDGSIQSVNEQLCKNLGYTREELCTMTVFDINPGLTKEGWQRHAANYVEIETPKAFEGVHRRKNGNTLPVEITVNYLKFENEAYFIAYVRDLTDQKSEEKERERLQAQLHQAQKMESVGRLAGGVAHDFNNMLSVILGYAEMMEVKISQSDPIRENVGQIKNAALRSRDIARQLLAFSRQQTIMPVPINLNDHLQSLQKTLLRLIGEDIELILQGTDDLWPVKFDPSQLDQILINLVVNARDACPGCGKIAIELRNTILDSDSCRYWTDCAHGNYVLLEVSDNGSGIEPEILAHIFEPFFTTKGTGQGTGLGLATVYGIVKQHNGQIRATSKPGAGSTFQIYLPRYMGEQQIKKDSVAAPPPSCVQQATILLVEDDAMVREMTTQMLKTLGHTVLVAETPTMALALCEEESRQITLLMTDVVMPEMNGAQLRGKIRVIMPGVRVLFMSGYTASVIGQHGVLEEGVNFIQKPFTMNDLATKVAEAMGEEKKNSS